MNPAPVRYTLFWKYAACFSGLVSALLIASGTLASYFAYRQSVEAIEDAQRAKAHFVAIELAGFIARLEEALRATAAKFRDGDSIDLEYLRLDLIALLRHYPTIAELHWIGSDGREQLALSRIARDTRLNGDDRSREASFVGASGSRRYVGPVYFRGGSEPFVSIAVSDGAGRPVLLAEVNLKFIGEAIGQARLDAGGAAYVVDDAGRLVSHPDITLVLARTDLSALPQVRRALASAGASVTSDSGRDFRGLAILSAAAPIRHLGWTVFVEQSREQAFRPVYAFVGRSMGLVLVGLIAAIGASLVLARRMARPIREMESAARAIGAGRLDQRIDIQTGDELEALGRQFNHMAERLRDMHATQEMRIAERTRELAHANEAKSRFLAAASHDLRQPMHALALFVGQLRAASGSPEAAALLDRIEQSTESLHELFEALLDLSKLDMGTVVPQPMVFPIHDLLSRLVADFTLAAEAKGLALTQVPTSMWVCSDPLLLERILLNLLDNAIRYTVDGRILIGCRRRRERIDVVVADTGIGIAPEHVPNIFQEFYRAAPLSLAPKGLGLGLAIVQRLGRLLDHAIVVESRLGKGTVVRVQVPRAVPGRREIAVSGPARDGLRNVRILVVDDDASARDAVRGLLAQWGCDVVAVAGGDEAVDRTRAWSPDIVLCDVNLANGESGPYVVDRLRALHGRRLACAFITGEYASDRIAEARSRDEPIAFKPMRPGKVRALIEYLLESRRHSSRGREATA